MTLTILEEHAFPKDTPSPPTPSPQPIIDEPMNLLWDESETMNLLSLIFLTKPLKFLLIPRYNLNLTLLQTLRNLTI